MLGARTGQNKFQVITKATKDIKAASSKEASKVFKDLYKNDPEFREHFRSVGKYFQASPKYSGLRQMLWNENLTDKQLTKLYDLYNATLVDHTPEGITQKNKFFEGLAKLGYGAVLDVNDAKYSGFNAKAPVIIFDRSAYVQDTVRRLTDNEVNTAKAIQGGKDYLNALAPSGIMMTPLLAISASESYDQNVTKKSK